MRFSSILFVAIATGLCTQSATLAQITWSGGASGNGTAWATTSNWAGGSIPGSISNSANMDVAEFAAAGTSTSVGINFTNLGGTQFYLGTVNVLSTHTVVRTIGSNASASGVVQLNGTGANNLILSNASTNLLTLAPRATGTGGNMSLRLDAIASTINAAGTGGITVSANIAENGTGKGITKVGAGLLTLSGDNTYTGGTDVQVGELRVSGITGSNTGTGNVTVQGGTTLSGTGRVLPGAGNLLTVLNAGTIRGDSGTGTGTLTTGNLTIQSGGQLDVQFGTGSSASRLNSSAGVLNLNMGAVLDPNGTLGGGDRVIANIGSGAGALIVGGTTYDTDATIATYTYASGTGLQAFGALQIDVTDLSLTAGDGFTLRREGNNLVLNFSPVPEPASLLAVCGLAVGGLVGLRKLRRKATAIVG